MKLSIKTTITNLALSCTLALASTLPAYAVDIAGVVNQMRITADGSQLWFSLGNQSESPYCQSNWVGDMFIPTSDPNFAYYYGFLTTSLTKSIKVYIANISMYSHSTACDLTKTGYGIVLTNTPG